MFAIEKQLTSADIGRGRSHQRAISSATLTKPTPDGFGFRPGASGPLTILLLRAGHRPVMDTGPASRYTVKSLRARNEKRLTWSSDLIARHAAVGDRMLLARLADRRLYWVISREGFGHPRGHLYKALSTHLGSPRQSGPTAPSAPDSALAMVKEIERISILEQDLPDYELFDLLRDLPPHLKQPVDWLHDPCVEYAREACVPPAPTALQQRARDILGGAKLKSLRDPTGNPDMWLRNALAIETRLFIEIERALNDVYKEHVGTSFRDQFDYFKGLGQRRGTRRGSSLESHFAAILNAYGIPFLPQPPPSKVDFWAEPVAAGRRSRAFISCKTTLRERWAQDLRWPGGAGERFLLTVERHVPRTVLAECKAARITICSSAGQVGTWSVRDLVTHLQL